MADGIQPSKCKTLCISNKKHPPQKRYLFCGVELDQVEEISYLGITFTSKLKWNHHVSSVASKATKVLGVMRRNLWNFPKKVRENSIQIHCTTQARICINSLGSLY